MFDIPIRRRYPFRVPMVLVAVLAIVWVVSGYKVDFHYAAQKGHLFVVWSLVRLNPQLVFSRDRSGDTPLHLAANEGHKDVVEFLIAHRAEVNAVDNFGETALSDSILFHAAVAKLLLARGADVNAARGAYTDLLSRAATNGDAELVSMLLARNANIDDSLALNRAGNKAVVELLLAHGADLHGRDWIGRTPLEDAAAGGRVEAMAALLVHENKENVMSAASAALQAAAAEGRYHAVEYLLTHGADVNARCYNGNTPLSWAVGYRNLNVAHLLLLHGADVRIPSDDGKTPLHWAAQADDLQMAKLLLEYRANVNASTQNGGTPLHDAAARGSMEMVKLLLGERADINARKEDGETPLVAAVSAHQSLGMVNLLLVQGADPNAQKDDGQTALRWRSRVRDRTWRSVSSDMAHT